MSTQASVDDDMSESGSEAPPDDSSTEEEAQETPNPLQGVHQRDAVDLTNPRTRAACGPFETECRECLDTIFNGDPPDLDNSCKFLMFHA